MRGFDLLPGLSVFASSYHSFIVDLWGVMHDGVTAFPEALDCLEKLKQQKAKVVILSNAPRRAHAVAARNRELGIEDRLVDLVLSSGELAWRHLADRPDDWYRRIGRRCYHLGPGRDAGMREGLSLLFTDELSNADFILLTGPLGHHDTVDDYISLLEDARDRKLPMICANPDYVVIRGGRREICAGAIALKYQELGGEVRYHGKPDPSVYRACLDALGLREPDGILAIGDSLRTDIAGATGFGMDSLFVAGGIHGEELGMDKGKDPDREKLTALIASAPAKPKGVLSRLFW